MKHDTSTCLDLDCETCFPPYIPKTGDVLRDARGARWTVTFTGMANHNRGRIMQIRHAVYGHYADVPLNADGTIQGPGTYAKI